MTEVDVFAEDGSGAVNWRVMKVTKQEKQQPRPPPRNAGRIKEVVILLKHPEACLLFFI